jgi:hypothetical protein
MKQYVQKYLLELIVGLAIILILLAGFALGQDAPSGAKAAPAQPAQACAQIWLPPC